MLLRPLTPLSDPASGTLPTLHRDLAQAMLLTPQLDLALHTLLMRQSAPPDLLSLMLQLDLIQDMLHMPPLVPKALRLLTPVRPLISLLPLTSHTDLKALVLLTNLRDLIQV